MKVISEEKLANLLRDKAFATALACHYIDEWESFEEALNDPLFNKKTYYEYISQSDEDITKDFQSV